MYRLVCDYYNNKAAAPAIAAAPKAPLLNLLAPLVLTSITWEADEVTEVIAEDLAFVEALALVVAGVVKVVQTPAEQLVIVASTVET